MKVKCDRCDVVDDTKYGVSYSGRAHAECKAGGFWRRDVAREEFIERYTVAAHDLVNHPPHYAEGPHRCDACGHHIECIEVTRHLNFNRGNAVKCIWRAGKKGDKLEDLRKAAWYIADEIKRLEKHPVDKAYADIEEGHRKIREAAGREISAEELIRAAHGGKDETPV